MENIRKLSGTTISLHWLIAIGMIGSLIFGLYVEDLPSTPDSGELIGLHKSLGLLVLLFALIRLWNTTKTGFPAPLSVATKRQQKMAKAVHLLLLAGTILMPLSGILMSVGGGYPVGFFGIGIIPAQEENELLSQLGHITHGLGGNIIIATIILHTAAAIKHSVIDKDGTLRRITGRPI